MLNRISDLSFSNNFHPCSSKIWRLSTFTSLIAFLPAAH